MIKASKKAVRKSRLSKVRPIDRGTVYDLTRTLRQFIRALERGEIPQLTDLIIITRFEESGDIQASYAGGNAPERRHWMLMKAMEQLSR